MLFPEPGAEDSPALPGLGPSQAGKLDEGRVSYQEGGGAEGGGWRGAGPALQRLIGKPKVISKPRGR